MAAKQKTKRELASEQKKAQICSSAEELFNQYGYENTTLRDISSVSGFSIGSIYHFFGTKENILLAISQKMAKVNFDFTDIDRKVLDPYKYIMEYLLDYSQKWESLGVDLTMNIYRIFPKAYADPANNRVRNLESVNSLAEFIRLCQVQGTFDTSMSPEDASAYIFTLCRGLLYEWCLFGGNFSVTDKARSFLPRIIRTFITEKETPAE